MKAHGAKLPSFDWFIPITTLAVTYAASGYLGWLISHSALQGMVIYPAAGLAVAILLGAGKRVWLGVPLGVLLLYLLSSFVSPTPGGTGWMMQMPIVAALAATVHALLGVLLIQRRFGKEVHLHGSRDLIFMLLYAGPVACTMSATIAALGIYAHGVMSAHSAMAEGVKIWAGASLGVVVFLPLSLVTISPDDPRRGLFWKEAPLRNVLTPLAALILLTGLFLTAFTASAINADNAQNHRKMFSAVVGRNDAYVFREFGSLKAVLDDVAEWEGDDPHPGSPDWRQILHPSLIEPLQGLDAVGILSLKRNSALRQEIASGAKMRNSGRPVGLDNADFLMPVTDANAGSLVGITLTKSFRTALRASLETGHPIAARVMLSFGSGVARSRIILLQPVPAGGTLKGLGAERSSQIHAWSFALLNPKFLFPPSAGDDAGAFLERLELSGSLDGAGIRPAVFVDRAGTTQPRHEVKSDFFNFGRHWSLTFASTRAFEVSANHREGWIALVGGMLVTLLFAGVVQLLSGRERQIKREVKFRTAELAHELRKSKSIFLNADVAILLLQTDGTVLSANPASASMFSVPTSRIVNHKIEAVLKDEFIESYLVSAKEGQVAGEKKELHFETFSGCEKWLEARLSAFEGETGEPTVTLILKDVTDSVEARKELEAAERRWNMALAGSQIGVFDLDLTTGHTLASEAWRRLAGIPLSADVDISAEWEARVHSDDLARVKQADQDCFDGKTDSVFVEYRLKRMDGTWRWMRGSARVVERDAEGRALRYLGTMMDVTELRNALDKAHSEEENLSSLIETAPVGMAVLDINGNFLITNDAFLKFTGYSKDTLARTPIQDLEGAAEFLENRVSIRRLVRGETQSYSEEKRFFRPDGTVAWGLLSGSALHEPGSASPRFIVQVQDVTEAKQMEAMKGDFVATVSHELRTPLTSINGSLGLVLGAMSKELPAKAAQLLKIAQQNGDRLLHLVNDLLDMQRLSSGSFQLHPEEVEIRDLVRQAAEETRFYVARFDVTLRPVLPAEAVSARLDGNRFKQVLTNFISNAAKFSNEGEPVTIALEREGNQICVAVTNNGRGIPKDFQEKIFRPFSQAAAASTRDREGSGLGLAISKEIVEHMGGTIGFTSEPDVSTTFWFRLPIADTSNVSATQGNSETSLRRTA